MRGSSSRRKRGSVTRDGTGGSPAMTTDGYHGVVSHQQGLGLRRQDPTACIINQAAYNNATLAPGGSTTDYEAGPVTQTTKTVKEVEIGPGIILGCVSLKDYCFITSLPVVETVKEVQIGPGITLGCVSLRDYCFITSLPVVEEEQH